MSGPDTGTIFEKMTRRTRPDDDFSMLPGAGTVAALNRELIIFLSAEPGDRRIMTKLFKQRAEIAMALEYVRISPGETVLDLNSDDGALGIALASRHPDARFLLFDSDVRCQRLTRRNAEANYEVQNLEEIDGEGLESIREVDVVVICPKRYDSQDQIVGQLTLAMEKLKMGGRIFLVSHKKAGAETIGEKLGGLFGGETELVGRGRGGYRVFAAAKKSETATKTQLRRTIKFEVLDQSFELQTEPSLFSKDGLDEGTRALLESVSLAHFKELLDVGCGWGAIGLVAATINKDGRVVMVDVDTRAIKVARDNAQAMGLADRVKVSATDDIRSIEGGFDLVLSNPPFHADVRELVSLFDAARKRMAKRGGIYVVVEQSYLSKMQGVLESVFGSSRIHKKIEGDNNYYILSTRK